MLVLGGRHLWLSFSELSPRPEQWPNTASQTLGHRPACWHKRRCTVANLQSTEDDIELQPLRAEQRVTSISPRLAWLIFLGLGIFLWLVREILLPFVIAAAAAFVLSPVVDWLSARFGLRRWMTAAGVALLLLGLVVLIGFSCNRATLRRCQKSSPQTRQRRLHREG